MSLDPQAQKLLDAAKATGLPPIDKVSVAEARSRMAKALTLVGDPEIMARVDDFCIPSADSAIPVRCYRPSLEKNLPAVVFFHGGGWTLNSINTHDHLCRALANQSGCVVLSVEYRLAPEHPFPAAIDDAWTSVQWVSHNSRSLGLDAKRIGVVGDSSGGTQAAVIAQMAHTNGGPHIACQALIYPVVDHYSVENNSYREMGTGYSLTRNLMVWFWSHYLPNEHSINDPRACPLRASCFSKLPPTLVLTAEFDPLRDEGEEYAKRLQAAGVRAKASRYTGMMHGFVIQFRSLDKGRMGLAEVASFLRAELRPSV